MSSNDQDNNKKPWGGGNNGTPPDLDEVINEFKNKFSNVFGGDKNNKSNNINAQMPSLKGLKYVVIVVILVWLLFGIYIVGPAEKGVVLRFGAFQEVTSQGPHWRLPYPIETVTKINVEQIRTAEIGYRNIVNNGKNYGGNVASESVMLTKDENMIEAKFAVQYNINDVESYLFNVVDPDLTLRQATESAIRQVVGQNTMDYVLTDGRHDIAQSIKERTQELLDLYKTGLYITTVNMQDAQPPEQVQASFSDAVKAREDKQRLINEAQTYANDILPKSRGKSARIIEEAKAYKSQVVSKSEGEASRFKQILTEYLKAPEVTRERLYLETMEIVLGSASKVISDSNASNLMYLPIDKLINANPNVNNNAKVETIGQSDSTFNAKGNSVRSVFNSREVR